MGDSSASNKEIFSETTPLKSRDHAGDHGENAESARGGVVRDKFLIFKLMVATGAASATLGFDVGIMADAILPLEYDMQLNSVEKELAMGSLNFVAALGALLGGTIADKSGRKATLKACGWIFIVGAALMTCAQNFTMLLLGRIFTGLGVGVGKFF